MPISLLVFPGGRRVGVGVGKTQELVCSQLSPFLSHTFSLCPTPNRFTGSPAWALLFSSRCRSPAPLPFLWSFPRHEWQYHSPSKSGPQTYKPSLILLASASPVSCSQDTPHHTTSCGVALTASITPPRDYSPFFHSCPLKTNSPSLSG